MTKNSFPALLVFSLLLTVGFSIDSLHAQSTDEENGSNQWTQWGVLDGNRVRTLYSNHGEIARWPDQPSGE